MVHEGEPDKSARWADGALVVHAPAKVNLHLGIHEGRDGRGYHRADSLMAPLALEDEVFVVPIPGRGLSVTMVPALDVSGERTLVARVARQLADLVGTRPDVDIRVVRHIPDKSGLGSSSTDAAATMRALCELWGMDARDDRVVSLARAAGADVAFFLDPVVSLLDGVGDCLRESFAPLGGLPVVLVRPEGGVSTAEAYAEFDRDPIPPADPAPLCAALRTGRVDAHTLSPLLSNNLQATSERLQPQVGQVRIWLEAQPGTLATLMCGSGSCVFSLCEDVRAAERVAGAAGSLGWWSCVTHLR